MARKKKRKSTPQNISPPDDPESQDVPVAGARPLVAALSVKVVKGPSKRAAPLIPHITLSEQDAGRLDLRAEEEVIVLSKSGAAVARTEISSRSSPGGSQLTTKPLSPGSIHVLPSPLLDMLTSQKNSPSDNTAPALATPLPSRLPPTTPSSDKSSSFSFKVGGGGDELYSPSPLKLSSPPRTPQQQKTGNNLLWIIPRAGRLGRTLSRRFCANATKIVLEVLSNNTRNISSKVKPILERLVLAHTVGRYVQSEERLRISFQGKPLDFIVKQVEGDCWQQEENLAKQVADLNLEESTEVEREVLELAKSSGRRICKILYSTQVECILQDPLEPDDCTVPANRAVSLPLQPAGLGDTVKELRSFLSTPLQQADIFARGTIKPPRGVLLHGPSGVGKTLVAHQMAAEFRDSGVTVEFVSCSSLQSKTAIVGEAERQLTRYFRKEEKAKLLILDDVHLICPRRGGPGSTDRLAATLLALVDGIDSDVSSFVILAITSNPSLLDPALRRPGRLDSEIEVPLPDEPAVRVEIIKCQLASLHTVVAGLTNDDDEWVSLGKLAKGFNGADCMLATKEAVRSALLRASSAGSKHEERRNPIEIHLEELRAAIRSTKPSAIKSITVEIPQVKWSSIGGMECVKRELREAIEMPITHEAAFKSLGVPAPRGILLYGPPGCSKTLMARALATEGQMNFLAVKGPELLSKWLGESERALASLFRRARMASPAIIFFDEIDAIATKRGSGDSASSGRMLSQLLTELDGVNHTGSAAGSKPHRVVVVGATNRPDLLDNALTRPGRIDRTIYVGVPDTESRSQIFEISLRGKSCADDIDIPHLARDEMSQGFSGAEVVAICRDAALLALEESDDPMAEVTPKIRMRHLVKAIEEMQRQITPDMLDFYASYREARNQ